MVSLKLKSVEREYKLGETTTIFDSIGVTSSGERFNFCRYIPPWVPWPDSLVLFNGRELGSGEDTRAFLWKDIPCVYTNSYSYEHSYHNKIYHTGYERWFFLILPKKLEPGKNWSPLVVRDELFFIHEISPFRLLKARPIKNEKDSFIFLDTVFELPVKSLTSVDNYSTLRGGGNALPYENCFIGFGHTNEYKNYRIFEDIIHRPFLWKLETGLTPSVTIFPAITEPFEESYQIVDPTCFFIENGKYYIMTCETQLPWYTRNQNGRSCIYEVIFF